MEEGTGGSKSSVWGRGTGDPEGIQGKVRALSGEGGQGGV